MTDVLVIGYGNDLRSDDGAGRRVAAAVEGFVDTISVPQLTPEHALQIAGRSTVVFVDADVDVDRMTVTRAGPSTSRSAMTHHGSPAAVLGLVPEVGDAPAEAWVLSIPAVELGLGEELSPVTAAAVAEAVAWIERLARSEAVEPAPGD